MELHEGENWKIYHGNMLDMLEVIKPNSIDSIVTDPPYELNFMNKGWDSSGIAFQKETWEKCYEVLKSGGYLLAFGGSRTHHRIACAIEDAGFEIRDMIMWLVGSGFPKSMNIGLAIDKRNGIDNRTGNIRHDGGQGGGVRCFSDDNYEWKKDYEERKAKNKWEGWGTALKPSYEAIIVARKPCEGSCVDNVLKYGVGGINIDECRVGHNEATKFTNRKPKAGEVFNIETSGYDNTQNHIASADARGRFPANTILTYDETDYEEVCGGMPITNGNASVRKNNMDMNEIYGHYPTHYSQNDIWGDSGSASRYFYCAKASKRDRDEGLEAFETKQCVGGGGGIGDYLTDVNSASGKYGSEKAPHKNIHPCCKPTSLMQYLVRLVTPKSGTILDPFNGSGSTGKAVMYENNDRNADYKYIGIEMTGEYIPISIARIKYASGDTVMIESEEQSEDKQMSIFDLMG